MNDVKYFPADYTVDFVFRCKCGSYIRVFEMHDLVKCYQCGRYYHTVLNVFETPEQAKIQYETDLDIQKKKKLEEK